MPVAKAFLLLSLILVSPLNGAEENSVFGAPACKDALEALGAVSQEFYEKGIAEGLTIEEATELGNRAVRYRYLQAMAEKALIDANGVNLLVEMFWREGFIGSDGMNAEYNLLFNFDQGFQVLLLGQPEFPKHYPLIYETFHLAPPVDESRAEKFSELLSIRALLARSRAEFSMPFVELYAPKTTVTEADRELIDEAYFLSLKAIMENLYEFDEPLAESIEEAKDPTTLEEWYTRKLLRRVLASERCPPSLKTELEWEDRFEKKYGLPRHPLHRALIHRTAAYYGIPAPELTESNN